MDSRAKGTTEYSIAVTNFSLKNSSVTLRATLTNFGNPSPLIPPIVVWTLGRQGGLESSYPKYLKKISLVESAFTLQGLLL